MLALVEKDYLELVHMDMKIAFIHGNINDDIYMQQPKDFIAKGKEHMVWRLKKSFYGLKHALREWYQNFDTFMRSQGYRRSQEDHYSYTKKMPHGS